LTNAQMVKMTGWALASAFAVVGLIFVAIPGRVLAAFNGLAAGAGWPESTTDPHTLFLALAVAYMYVVT